MTTVQVEFRHKNHDAELGHKDPGWRVLTGTIPRPEGERILATLDPAMWVARLAPVGRVPSSSLAEVLSKLGADSIPDFAQAYDRFQKGSATAADIEDGLSLVRRHVFGNAFEAHGHSPEGLFKRWEKVKVEHTKSCKHKAFYEVEIAEVRRASTWLIRAEMERRIAYLNDHALPALGMSARARTLPVRKHGGACEKCKKSAIGFSIAVEVTFGEYVMVREYDCG